MREGSTNGGVRRADRRHQRVRQLLAGILVQPPGRRRLSAQTAARFDEFGRDPFTATMKDPCDPVYRGQSEALEGPSGPFQGQEGPAGGHGGSWRLTLTS